LEAELTLAGVRKCRPDQRGAKVEILCGIDLEVPAGELTAIVGPSGGGKSTLVRLLNRLEEADAGRILLRGEELKCFPVLELRRRVGLVLQKPFMFPGSVLDNLQLPFRYRGNVTPEAGDARLAEVLRRCGLTPELLEREARSLSVGQQQRVCLARTLLPGPSLLVLDEPTSALDRPTGDRLADTLRTICREQQLTVVMVTHDLRLAGRVADHLAYLEGGRIFEAGPAATLLRSPASPELRRFLAGGDEEGD
jgi:UDP-glucose/iron transport system ATP-binding protein